MDHVPRELEPYRVDHLFLLMGLNPLPNYVVAKLLLKPNASLYLIHSEGPRGTGQFAQRLASQFTSYRPQLIPVDVYNPGKLRRAITRYVHAAVGSIGLNYTGGTKVMAIHAYQAVDETCKERGVYPLFSYLDADTLELIIEPPPGRPPFSCQIVKYVEVDFRTLFGLHGIDLRVAPRVNPQLPQLAQALARLHATPAGVEAWRKGRQVMQTCERRPWAEVEEELHQLSITSAVTAQLEQALGFADAVPVTLETTARKAGFKSRQELFLWFNGAWMEDWVLACIEAIGYQVRARSLVGYAPGPLEIDVATMRGYQLFALSCSVTLDRKVAKLKLLEIYARARQLGGDEARIGLVCPTEDPLSLEREVTGEWDVGGRVRVFGAQHFEQLQSHLQSWLEST